MIATTAIGKHCLLACNALGVNPEVLALQKDASAAFAPVVRWMYENRPFKGTISFVEMAAFWSGGTRKFSAGDIAMICNPPEKPVAEPISTKPDKPAPKNKGGRPGHTDAAILAHFRGVCRSLEVDADEVLSRTHSHARVNVRLRDRVIWAMRAAEVNGTGRTPGVLCIGRLFGMDHSSILAAAEREGKRLAVVSEPLAPVGSSDGWNLAESA